MPLTSQEPDPFGERTGGADPVLTRSAMAGVSHHGNPGEVQVEIFSAGDGINYPAVGQTVTVHYTASLLDGSQWDSSRDRGKPFKFKLGAEQVIPGLDRGVSQLSIGERATLIIPPALGCKYFFTP